MTIKNEMYGKQVLCQLMIPKSLELLLAKIAQSKQTTTNKVIKDLLLAGVQEIGDTKVDIFLKELEEVCKKHGFSLAHEDTQGGFIVEKYNKELSEWLQQAAAGATLKNE